MTAKVFSIGIQRIRAGLGRPRSPHTAPGRNPQGDGSTSVREGWIVKVRIFVKDLKVHRFA